MMDFLVLMLPEEFSRVAAGGPASARGLVVIEESLSETLLAVALPFSAEVFAVVVCGLLPSDPPTSDAEEEAVV